MTMGGQGDTAATAQRNGALELETNDNTAQRTQNVGPYPFVGAALDQQQQLGDISGKGAIAASYEPATQIHTAEESGQAIQCQPQASSASTGGSNSAPLPLQHQSIVIPAAEPAATTSFGIGQPPSELHLGVGSLAAPPAQANGHTRTASGGGGGQWMLVATQTTQGVRQRMSMASDQLGHSLRQLYASASSITDVPPSYHNIPGIVPYYHGRSSGPPPSYDDVVNPYAPPPTYQSLFGQMREARKTSRGLVDLLRRLLIIFVSTLGCTILIAFMILIPFTMIIVGAIYIDECRVEHIPTFLLVGGLVWASKNIIHCYAQCQPEPDPLDFGGLSGDDSSSSSAASGAGAGLSGTSFGDTTTTNGAAGLPPSMASMAGATRRSQQPLHHHHHGHLKSSICESLLNCVLFGWFIAGCVIVFRNYEPDFENSASVRYCHRTVYLYTFWLITSAIVIFGLFIGCICCLMVSSAIASRQEDDLA